MAFKYTTSGPLFIEYLKTQSQITSKIFGFYLATEPTKSKVQIGYFSTSYMKDSTNVATFVNPNSYYW